MVHPGSKPTPDTSSRQQRAPLRAWGHSPASILCWVGQNHVHTLHMTVYMGDIPTGIDARAPCVCIYAWIWPVLRVHHSFLGLATTVHHTYIQCIYGIFSREITIHTFIYGVHIRFWTTRLIFLLLQVPQLLVSRVSLKRIHVYTHHIWPYIWWFPCQNYRIYTVHIWFWPTLHMFCRHLVICLVSLIPVTLLSHI